MNRDFIFNQNRTALVEGGAKIYEPHSDMCVFLVQVCQGQVQGSRHGIISGPICTISIPMRVQVWGQGTFDVLHDHPLKALHDDGCQCYGAIIVQAGYRALLWDWNDGGRFEAFWYNRLTQGCVKNVCEDIFQLFCTVPEYPSRYIVRPAAFRGLTFDSTLLTLRGVRVREPGHQAVARLSEQGCCLWPQILHRIHSAGLGGRGQCYRQGCTILAKM